MDDLKKQIAAKQIKAQRFLKGRPDHTNDTCIAVKGELQSSFQDGSTPQARTRRGQGVVPSPPSMMSITDHEETVTALQNDVANIKKSSEKEIKKLVNQNSKLQDEIDELIRSVLTVTVDCSNTITV